MSVVTRQLTGPANVPFRRLMSKVSRTVPSKTTYLFPVDEGNAAGRDGSGLDRKGSEAGVFCCSPIEDVIPPASRATVYAAGPNLSSSLCTLQSTSVAPVAISV